VLEPFRIGHVPNHIASHDRRVAALCTQSRA
jgi:hypothetical protein